MERLDFPRKEWRALIIKDYVTDAGYRGVVSFSCGNAARALKDVGLYVVEVSPSGPLQPGKWWEPEEIHRAWPDLFDATSGHLPIPLMVRMADAYRRELGLLGTGPYRVATGSGETITCLRWAYPLTDFRPVYNVGMGTEHKSEAPLNVVVASYDKEFRIA